jgi:hypothetical protein
MAAWLASAIVDVEGTQSCARDVAGGPHLQTTLRSCAVYDSALLQQTTGELRAAGLRSAVRAREAGARFFGLGGCTRELARRRTPIQRLPLARRATAASLHAPRRPRRAPGARQSTAFAARLADLSCRLARLGCASGFYIFSGPLQARRRLGPPAAAASAAERRRGAPIRPDKC